MATWRTTNTTTASATSSNHFAKAGRQATKLGDAIETSNFGAFGDCSHMIGLVKHNMKFTHEVAKTELYLLPAIDLGILLLNTHKAYTEAFAKEIGNYETAIVAHIYGGSHKNCKTCCYRPKMAGVPIPTKPLKGIAGSQPKQGAVGNYTAPSSELTDALTALVELRKTFSADIGSTRGPGIAKHQGTKARLGILYRDAGRRYDNPGPLKRFRHYTRNSFTRKTHTENVMNVVNKGVSLTVSVGTAAGGSVFGQTVGTPLIQKPIAAALKAGIPVFGLLDGVIAGGADKAVKTIGSIPASMAKTGSKTTIKAGAKTAMAVAKFIGNYAENK